MSVETDLITAYYNRLTGADSYSQSLIVDGKTITPYTGNAPPAARAPYIVIGRPRTRGAETLDGVSHPEVRLQLRVHTAYEPGKGNHFFCYEIAEAAHDLLEAAPITVDGKEPYVPEPDKQPIPSYDKGEEEALDLSVDYRYSSL